MKKWLLTGFLLIMALFFCPTDTILAADVAEGMERVAASGTLELYLNREDTSVAVRDNASGYVWYSNPIDIEEDEVATSYYKKVLRSQLVLTYINHDTQVSTINNYSSSIEDGQFEIEMLSDGVRILYHIGDFTAPIYLPDIISQERYEMFTAQMEGSALRKLARNYSLNDEGNYILRNGVKDYMKEELATYFADVGYTEEDYVLDMERSGEEKESGKAWFDVPMTYRLEQGALIVEIDPAEIQYNDEDFYLVGVDVLRYFGAAAGEDGYLFVPDGSGALIHFDNGKTDVAPYQARMYGQDATFAYSAWEQSQVDYDKTARLPVFGIKNGAQAHLAIIEGGDAYASVNADIGGKTTSYNISYASFDYLSYGALSLDDIVGANSYYMYSQPVFAGTYKLRFMMLSDEDADYSGMARAYRAYLNLQKTSADALPMYVEWIGAIDKPKTFLGIKYNALVTLTTYRQAASVADDLKENGVQNLNLICSGFANRGLHGTSAMRVKFLRQLSKGGMNLTQFEQHLTENNIDLYMTSDLQYVYQDRMFDGYSAFRYAPRYFDNTTVTVNRYGIASRTVEETLADLISPRFVQNAAETVGKALRRVGVSGVNVGTLSYELYSDQSLEGYQDRQMALLQNWNALQSLSDAGLRILTDDANAYALGVASDCVNLPSASNRYLILDEDVPFYAMVLHGSIDYAGGVLNLSGDYETSLLQCVEQGAGLYFKWIGADGSLLKDTDYDVLYSVEVDAWLAQSKADYAKLNEAIGDLTAVPIKSHERLSETLVRVTYENGKTVYVNYGYEETAADGVTVGGRDFLVR